MSGSGIIFTRDGVRRGARQAIPLVIGTFPFGLVVGVISAAKGLSMLETLVMCGLVFAGSAQLLALELWTDPAPVLAASLAALVVNMRLAPMGAALAPWLDRLRGWRLWGTLATLVDHSYALSAAEMRRGGRDAGYLLGVALALWVFWMIAVSVGHVFGAVVRLAPGHPLYFAATATFCAILVPVWQGVRRDLLPWMLAAVVALAAWRAGFGAPWPLLAGALSGASLGAWLELRRA
ncbi:AzlC family ABC transporter permease [Roseomonas sp. CAU 1739]|uniref:AzlC family ABC transporter permease n=1 Tax=Roseomonas sp. CAU 1739 TaxID=3140364 RepID=UPI00325B1136